MKAPQISDFDTRVGFESVAEAARNALNEPSVSAVLRGQTFAKRTDLRDSEKVAAGLTHSVQVARFLVAGCALARAVRLSDHLVLGGAWNGAGGREAGEVWRVGGVKVVRHGHQDFYEFTASKVDGA